MTLLLLLLPQLLLLLLPPVLPNLLLDPPTVPRPALAEFSWPVEEPRAMMFISHGYAEHTRPYFSGVSRAASFHHTLSIQ